MKYTKDELRRSMLLYAITDRMWLKDRPLVSVCRQVLEHGATFLQLREKDLDSAAFLQEAEALSQLCKQYRVPFVVNDRVDIALSCGADGVHVGQSDICGRDIRALIGADRLLGISAGTVGEAVAAQQAGADYIGVGAVFGTTTKKGARSLTVEALREIVQAVSIPVVAIGGINAENICQLKGSHVDGVAVISAIFGADVPGVATAQLLARVKDLVVGHG